MQDFNLTSPALRSVFQQDLPPAHIQTNPNTHSTALPTQSTLQHAQNPPETSKMANKRPSSPKEKSCKTKNRRSWFGARRLTEALSSESGRKETTSPPPMSAPPVPTPTTPARTVDWTSIASPPGPQTAASLPTTPRPRHIDIFEAVQNFQARSGSSNQPAAAAAAAEPTPRRKAAEFFTAGEHVFGAIARDILAQRQLEGPVYNFSSIAETAETIWREMVAEDGEERKFWDDVVIDARWALVRGEVEAEELLRCSGRPEMEKELGERAGRVVEAWLGREEGKDEGEEEEGVAVQQTLTPVRARVVDVGRG